jgi:hypothetical protein
VKKSSKKVAVNRTSKEQFRPELTEEDRGEMEQMTPEETVGLVGRMLAMKKKQSKPDTE